MAFWFSSCALAGRLATQADTRETANKARIESPPFSPRKRGRGEDYHGCGRVTRGLHCSAECDWRKLVIPGRRRAASPESINAILAGEHEASRRGSADQRMFAAMDSGPGP